MRLYVDPEAQADCDRIPEEDADVIVALLEEIGKDASLLECLLDPGDHSGDEADFHVTQFRHMYRQGYDIWRLKVFDLAGYLLPYRVIYAYDVTYRDVYVLAIMNRGANYEQDTQLVARLKRAYVRLGITVHSL